MESYENINSPFKKYIYHWEKIMSNVKQFVVDFIVYIRRVMISFLLFILPVKMSHIFLEIALTTLLVKTRNNNTTDIDMVKFFRLVNGSYSESTIDLPYYTVNYIWPSEFLDREAGFISGKRTVREVIKDNRLFKINMVRVVDMMLYNLPFLMRLKLGLSSEIRKRELRRSIITFLEGKYIVAINGYEEGKC